MGAKTSLLMVRRTNFLRPIAVVLFSNYGKLPMQSFVALFARRVALFALARWRPARHMERAFQASSPKLSRPGRQRSGFSFGRIGFRPAGDQAPFACDVDPVPCAHIPNETTSERRDLSRTRVRIKRTGPSALCNGTTLTTACGGAERNKFNGLHVMLRFVQLILPFSHLRDAGPPGIGNGPFRHPLPKLPRARPATVGSFF